MSHTDYILEDISLNLLSGRGVDLPTYILYEYDKMLGTLFLVEPNYVLQKNRKPGKRQNAILIIYTWFCPGKKCFQNYISVSTIFIEKFFRSCEVCGDSEATYLLKLLLELNYIL